MANKRDLKKTIKYVCGAIAGECVLSRAFIEGVEPEKWDEIIFELAELQENALKNVSFSFDKTPRDFDNLKAYHKAAKAYFAEAYENFHKEFDGHIDQIVKKMNALLPAEQREANKKAAAEK